MFGLGCGPLTVKVTGAQAKCAIGIALLLSSREGAFLFDVGVFFAVLLFS